ncbi:MFS transporter [Paenibacillus caui]|uniref:MFS transporter n=1 Tax=Paenibacillus caui TaxID=2873927 RepID=UPI001CA80FC3|nr:MFS transporter [Paenibacillus caui]
MSAKPNAAITSQSQLYTWYPVLFAISFVHLLNDTIQSVIPALFPILKTSLALSYSQIGLISLMINLTAAVLQPVIGLYTDSRPLPKLLPAGVLFTLTGVVLLAFASGFTFVLCAVMLIGIGSAIFHPESSRVAYLAGGAKKGVAQSIFQFGGNIGQSLAPVMTALVFVYTGQRGVIWFSLLLVIAFGVQTYVSGWYSRYTARNPVDKKPSSANNLAGGGLPKGRVVFAFIVLMVLVFSKNVYMAAITSYYSFFAISHFGLSTGGAQMLLFVFLVANVLGLIIGGMLADKFSRRGLIWFSILGTAPFALALPYANLAFSIALIFFAGLIMASSFSIIMVYANELLPGKVGLVSGIFFGLAFGLGGIGSAVMGKLADATSISFVISCSSYLPLLGLFTVLLPKDEKLRELRESKA